MATTEQVNKFIEIISGLAVAECTKRKTSGRKWILPSVCIAQAALETGWGASPIMVKANAYFGIKAGTNWTGKVFSTKTQECYDGINKTTITDLFRAYNSPKESVEDYYDLLTSLGRYAFACNQTDPCICIQAIWDGEYATDPEYVKQVMSIIDKHDLRKYDTRGAESMTKTEKAIRQMEAWANDDSHGYDQTYRWGEKGDYDCGSATISAWELAGVPVKSKGATYTGNMRKVFIDCGFEDVTAEVNRANGAGMRRGDVLLNEAHHVAMYCGSGMEVEASINEKGEATGGRPGDQTGKEFLIRSYRNYPWDCILRYRETFEATPTPNPAPQPKPLAVAYPARVKTDTKCFLGAGAENGQSKLWPVLKKDTLIDVMKGTEKDVSGKTWYLVRVAHPSEGFVYEYVPSGSFTHFK